MKIKRILLQCIYLLTTVSGFAVSKIEIKDNWYYLNGENYFIKAISYEIGARPGQHPYQGIRADDLDLLAFDLKVIKEAGYNTIRTWSPLSEAQLKLVQASGLKLIMGIDVNPEKDYGDAVFVRECMDKALQVMTFTRKYDCIITYLILNEPQTDHVHAVTGKAFNGLMKSLLDLLHKEHPGIPITISANAMISDYLDENLFDVYAYYCYDHTESQTATVGMCPFYYADGWWKGGDALTHNAEQPEEWFGFWGYSDVNDKYGSPRPVWFAMRDYMKGLILSPKNKDIYSSDTLPVELYTDKDVRKVLIKCNDKVLKTIKILKEGYVADHLVLKSKGNWTLIPE